MYIAPAHVCMKGHQNLLHKAFSKCSEGLHRRPSHKPTNARMAMHCGSALHIVNTKPETASCQMPCTYFMPNFTFLFSTIRSQMYLTDRY